MCNVDRFGTFCHFCKVSMFLLFDTLMDEVIKFNVAMALCLTGAGQSAHCLLLLDEFETFRVYIAKTDLCVSGLIERVIGNLLSM